MGICFHVKADFAQANMESDRQISRKFCVPNNSITSPRSAVVWVAARFRDVPNLGHLGIPSCGKPLLMRIYHTLRLESSSLHLLRASCHHHESLGSLVQAEGTLVAAKGTLS